MPKNGRKKLGRFRFFLIAAAGAIWMLCAYHTPMVLNIMSLKYTHPMSTSFMRYKAFFRPFKKVHYDWVSAKKISPYLKNAVIIAEDDQFYTHNGFDWKAIKNAAKTNWKRKKIAFGASTISQQLAKNLYLSPSKDPVRKAREVVLTVILDTYLSKERILELYLNIVEWGPNIYGAEAAARHYFGTSAKNLGPSQAAFLASILPNPVRYGKRGYHLTARGQSILRRIQ